MENQQTNVQTGGQKDYWNLAYKNFLHFFYFGCFITLVFIILFITKTEPFYQSLTIWAWLQLLIIISIWFVVSQMFKKHDKKAIMVSYLFLGVGVIFGLINFNLILLLLSAYLLWLVYKASKQPIVSTV